MTVGFCLPCSPSTGLGKYVIIDGQHKFSAAQAVRQRYLTANKQPPSWTETFRCTIIKPTKDISLLQRIAGRQQAKHEAVQSMDFSTTAAWYLREVEAVQKRAAEMGIEPVYIRSELLRQVYEKTGKHPSKDGTLVCFCFLPLHLAVGLMRHTEMGFIM